MADKKEKTIYISGHRNPDTDSICSAMALAELKNKISEKTMTDDKSNKVVYKAVRAGHLNQETRYVMKAFDVTAPTYMRDARTQIKDIFDDKTNSVSGNISLRQAWKTMREVSKATLAITDSEGHLEGLISTGDIAKSYMAVFDNCILAQAHTPYENIIDTVEGELLAGDGSKYVTSGKVVISTANTEIIRAHIDAGDVVILGNRYEAQLCALEQHASVIIVCDGAPVSRTIRKIAGDNDCAVISTAYDTYAVARLINQSLPVSYFMTKDNLVVFKENSYVDDIKDIMMKERIRDFPVVTEHNCYAGMISRRNLIDMNKKQFILVDHNEADQAINGIEETEIVEIIDHHKLGYVETLKPVYFRAQPVGCTGTIVYLIYKEKGVEIPADIAGLLCSAIISDTLMYRSPTCTALDIMAADALAKISGIEIESYAMEMFGAGSNLKSKSAEEIFYQDFKKFNAGSRKYGVGQITSINHEELDEIREKMIDYMQTAGEKHGVGMVFFMMTDILKESTELLCMGHGAYEAAVEAFDVEGDGTAIYLEGVVSRKKQLIPKLMAVLQN